MHPGAKTQHRWYDRGVLSVAKLTPGQEGYYERSVAAGLDDYYAGRGESPGMWTGRGAAALGLEGVVGDGQLGVLIRGLDPLSGELLRSHPRERTITVERINPRTGERQLEQKRLSPVAGFDLVFSVPKSVSLLHALGDEATRRAVNEAHSSAWQAALAYLEDEACVTRRGKGGVIREHAGGFVGAAYQHRTSRAQDPHLHTHVVVANMAKSPGGEKWRALDGEAILKSYRLAAGYLYQAHLRSELSRNLGVEWGTPVKGMAELRGAPPCALSEFSTRRRQVLEQLRGQSATGFYAAQVAAQKTRERKEHLDLDRLREEWRARAAEHGLGRDELAALAHRAAHHEPAAAELREIADGMLGPAGLTERRTAFSEPELVMAWAQAHPQGAEADRIRLLSDRFASSEGIERVGVGPEPGRPARYSTSDLIGWEKRALTVAERGDGDAPVVPEALVEQAADRQDGPRLSEEQEAMVRGVCLSGDRVVCVVGLAGAGKTTATRAVADAYRAAGVPIIGAAPSGVAAERLNDQTGIPSSTLHRLLRDSEQGLPDGCVVLVDEAGMADTRTLTPLLERVERAHGKAVLIGDPHQLPAVGAGGLFAGIVERNGSLKLSENRRQHDPAERDALAAVREGVGRDYLAYAEKNSRLIVTDNPLAARTRILVDWWQAARSDTAGNVMIALRRRDVADLNALARAMMDSHGRLGAERLTIAGREFAAGDRVVCLRNNSTLNVNNGTRGTIETVDPATRKVTIASDRGGRVELTERYLAAGNLRHAYALTGHSGQGITVEQAFVLATTEARLQEWGYVALSRARHATKVYITATERERESHAHDFDDRDSSSRLAQTLEESAVERLAVDQGPLPSGPKHDTRAEIERPKQSRRDQTRHRLIQQQQLTVTRLRAEAEQKISQAENQLRSAGRLHQRRRKDELRADIARARATIRTADEKLAVLTTQTHGRPQDALANLARAGSPDRSDRLARISSRRWHADQGLEI